jgi:uncharacterized protein (TIGR03435 family)
MMKALAVVGVGAFFCVRAYCQAPDQKPATAVEFEAATVKTNTSGEARSSRDVNKGRIILRNMPLKFLLASAYRVEEYQVSGAPGWFDSDRFDVVAKVPEGATSDDRGIMMQNLLKQSFNLVFHWEEKLLPGYALVVSKQGPKLTKSEPGKLSCDVGFKEETRTVHLSCQHATSANITLLIIRTGFDYLEGRHVVDNTGLTGSWEFQLDFARLVAYESDQDELSNDPQRKSIVSIFQAVEDQLGLKLESQKVPTPILAIDHIDRKPVGN